MDAQKISQETLRMAAETWGEELQVAILAEEAAELSAAALHMLRFRNEKSKSDFIEELADVEIMLAQMRLIFDGERIDSAIAKKMDRLKMRLEEV